MTWLFAQVWAYCLGSFLLGTVVAVLIPRRNALPAGSPLMTYQPAPADTPARPPSRQPVPDPPADETPTAAIAVRTAPEPTPKGSGRSPEFTVKGNRATMLYHDEDSPYFARVTADSWFASAEAAEQAGFTPWNRRGPRYSVADA